MYGDIQQWFKREGALFLKGIGIRSGYLVLDFGCGSGHYAIPAAKVVGKSGWVYALDQNRAVFSKLMAEASTMGLNNIVAVQSLVELSEIKVIQDYREGYGEGGFIVIQVRKASL